MMILEVVVFLFHLSLTNAADTAVNCLHCGAVASPNDCRETMVCGKGEICYTREFTDHRGLQTFSLGCEDEAMCNMSVSAQHLVGKRDGLNLDPAPRDTCYECCEGQECNVHLCQHKGSVHVNLTPPTTTNAHQEGSGFLPFSVAYKDKYYFFSSNMHDHWDQCRAFCKSFDADLVSINSQDEQEFLVQQLNKTGCLEHGFSWTGGSYSHSLHEWEWVDRSPVLYTHWGPGEPLSHNDSYHIAMYNPSCAISGRWYSYPSTQTYPFICEKQKI